MFPLTDKLDRLVVHYRELEERMADPQVAGDYTRLQELARERASLESAVTRYDEYRRVLKQIEDAQALAAGGDPELASLAREELASLESRRDRLEQELRVALLRRDPDDSRDVIVEIRSGTGGDEAALFAADLYRMYTRYAETQRWDVELVDSSPSGQNGFKEAVFEVRGQGAFSRLKFESGVHRVQRVPVTEAQGRIHTSTATVAVLPQASEVEVQVKPEELRIDIFHSGGAGGQNVNKVSTAVRIVHIPTGITAVCQDERSQLKNRQKAMAVLRARLYEVERRRREEAISQARRSQVGSADRSEKIRTYNYPQDRITDHRVGYTTHGLPRVLDGELGPIIEALMDDEQSRRLEEALAS
ncbi:MAG: peptide chain release factor 1 [Chloroflexota bacterium]|nr:peptide chain release factor 1 [Chloroflexota bacterium]